MITWNEKVGALNLTGKPLTGALLRKAPVDLDRLQHNYGFALNPGNTTEEMIEMAVVADVLGLLFPSLTAAEKKLEGPGASSFPRDRVLAFVCCIWFFTEVIPRVEAEGYPLDMNNLTRQTGAFLFNPYGDENVPGLIKIGIQYCKELGSQSPEAVIEWNKAFSQMVFIHYEKLTNDIDLGDFDLDATIGKMLTVFLSLTFALPASEPEDRG